ncbi:MAG: zinc dependent phospholipase family protein [Herbinix sp.]|jgi:hypothetical protein|nr:zinc dependent phospholipase family protein [Herbinix sp.]
MASWIVHLRIADKLLSQIETLSSTEFIVGNIAPDSGVPNSDWSAYTPPSEVSHFCEDPEDKKNTISPDKFFDKYLKDKSHGNKERSFYLGYYVHLLTDVFWHKKVFNAAKEKYLFEFQGDMNAFIWAMKGDWYDLDHLFLKKNPEFSAFLIYEAARDFTNTFMEEFAQDAFVKRQEYIVQFYRAEHLNLEREYKYLTEANMEQFVDEAVNDIYQVLKEQCKVSSETIKSMKD